MNTESMPQNGLYRAAYSITVQAPEHFLCKDALNRIKHLVSAFDYGEFKTFEHKSARKGDVLGRSINIVFEAYASDIILFRQAIDTVIIKTKVHFPRVSIEVANADVAPAQVTLDVVQ